MLPEWATNRVILYPPESAFLALRREIANNIAVATGTRV